MRKLTAAEVKRIREDLVRDVTVRVRHGAIDRDWRRSVVGVLAALEAAQSVGAS